MCYFLFWLDILGYDDQIGWLFGVTAIFRLKLILAGLVIDLQDLIVLRFQRNDLRLGIRSIEFQLVVLLVELLLLVVKLRFDFRLIAFLYHHLVPRV